MGVCTHDAIEPLSFVRKAFIYFIDEGTETPSAHPTMDVWMEESRKPQWSVLEPDLVDQCLLPRDSRTIYNVSHL